MRTVKEEAAFNRIIDCWEFQPGLNKKSFTPAKLGALPRGVKVLAYSDTSILFRVDKLKYHGSYSWTLNGWEFKRA